MKNFGPLTSEIAGALKADSLNYQGNKCGYDVPNLQAEIVLPTLKADEESDKESAPEQIEASAKTATPVAETACRRSRNSDTSKEHQESTRKPPIYSTKNQRSVKRVIS